MTLVLHLTRARALIVMSCWRRVVQSKNLEAWCTMAL